MPLVRWFPKTVRVAAACIGFFLFITVGGCGRKLPPIQPGAFPPPAVADLSYEISGGDILLAWSLPVFNPTKEGTVAGFKILRARRTADESDCPTCRDVFQEIGDIAASGRHPGSRIKFRVALEPGFKHRYKIRSYTSDGLVGRDSNTVVLTD
jgi:hypothetical protein